MREVFPYSYFSNLQGITKNIKMRNGENVLDIHITLKGAFLTNGEEKGLRGRPCHKKYKKRKETFLK